MTQIADQHDPSTNDLTLRDLDLVACPECGHPAEVEWRDEVHSTEGAVEHLKIRCLNRHWFLMPSDSLLR